MRGEHGHNGKINVECVLRDSRRDWIMLFKEREGQMEEDAE